MAKKQGKGEGAHGPGEQTSCLTKDSDCLQMNCLQVSVVRDRDESAAGSFCRHPSKVLALSLPLILG